MAARKRDMLPTWISIDSKFLLLFLLLHPHMWSPKYRAAFASSVPFVGISGFSGFWRLAPFLLQVRGRLLARAIRGFLPVDATSLDAAAFASLPVEGTHPREQAQNRSLNCAQLTETRRKLCCQWGNGLIARERARARAQVFLDSLECSVTLLAKMSGIRGRK